MPLDEEKICDILLKSHVIEYHEVDAPHGELYIEYGATTYCTIILHGRVLVTSGEGISYFGFYHNWNNVKY